MKLCRFELKSDPGNARSGMVYGGKIYETDGTQAIAVHDAEAIRPLPPIPTTGSVRLFRADLQPEAPADPVYFYTNPGCLVGASQLVNLPDFAPELGVEPYLAAVLATGGYDIDEGHAEEHLLGFTLLTVLVARGVEAQERASGRGFGRSHDIAATLGPVLTTPDELAEFVEDTEEGARLRLKAFSRVNGVEHGAGDTFDLATTFSRAISAASRSCTLRPADIIAIGPVVPGSEDIVLGPGDEYKLSVEQIGAIATKLASL